MCGIAGSFHFHKPGTISRQSLAAINDSMAHRGPDADAIWVSPDERIGLAHRRLAIIDLSPLGVQPMHSSDGRYTIVFNGEIYNYQALREPLLAAGHQFRSSSDTEVLLALFATEGEKMCERLRGMYAFAIWDNLEQNLFLARDPYGIKPLYTATRDGLFQFASQVKALLNGVNIDTSWDPAGIVSFWVWGHVSTPHTLYQGISELPPGHSMWVTAKGPSAPKRFQSLSQIYDSAEPFTGSPSDRDAILAEALRDSVRHHMIADVPVGLFLSAGLDSTSLLSLMADVAERPNTLTLGFEEFRNDPLDEVPLAEEVAREFRTHHQTIWITRDEFLKDAEDILSKMDQPSIDGVNTYLVSKYARRAGFTVALSGLGGDELFGGYPSFQNIPDGVKKLKIPSSIPGFGRAFRTLAGPILKGRSSPKYAGLFEYGGTWGGVYMLRRGHFLPHELCSWLDPDLVREGWNELRSIDQLNEIASHATTDHGKVALMEAQWYMRAQLLRDSDWASMAHSIELRVPMVDIELFRRLAPLIKGTVPPTKRDMANGLAHPLPSGILTKPKTGFSVPVREWLMSTDPSLADRSIRGFSRLVSQRFGLPASW